MKCNQCEHILSPSCEQRGYCWRHNKNLRYHESKKVARRRGISWDLTIEQYNYLMTLDCFYCNGAFDLPKSSGGLDRLNNGVGYTLKNVITCCERCNKTRGEHWSVNEAYVMIQAVLETYENGFTNYISLPDHCDAELMFIDEEFRNKYGFPPTPELLLLR